MATKQKKVIPLPPWQAPSSPSTAPQLRVRNSLTHDADLKSTLNVPFVPRNPPFVGWYTCGPTVYDSAHLGHARNYVTWDILRRIMEEYFGYQVQYVMNVTDVDDKIILRARQEFLAQKYASDHASIDAKVLSEVSAAWKHYFESQRKKIAGLEKKIKEATEKSKKKKGAKLKEMELVLILAKEKLSASEKLYEEQVVSQYLAESVAASVTGRPSADLLRISRDPLMTYLDNLYGPTVTQHEIFFKHAAKYEEEFFDDMRRLGVKPPDVITRVTEYVDQIAAFIERIVERKLAYEANGSVYFDVAEFTRQGHYYAKLEPKSRTNLEALSEGEGALTDDLGRKSPNDFALWKNSKPGEPFWPSKWGNGRPGWHIECSVMASSILGERFDVHSGGEDLKFPHHDNELAQSEAFFGSHQWVDYFLHAGHLHINGLKMSKSLKNFLTIRDVLAQGHTANQVRMMFLLSQWDKTVNFSESTWAEVKAKEKTFTEYFKAVRNVVLSSTTPSGSSARTLERWDARDLALGAELKTVQLKVHAALSESFDTQSAVEAMLSVVNRANVYIAESTTTVPPKARLLSKIAAYVGRVLQIFGLEYESASGDSSAASAGASSGSAAVVPFVDAICEFRNQIRAVVKDSKATPETYRNLTDKLRDEVLPRLGVAVIDDRPAHLKPYDFGEPAAILGEIETRKREREAGERDRQKRKQLQRRKDLVRDIEKWRKASQPPKPVPPEGALGEGGKEISKNARKALVKEFNAGTEAHKQLQEHIAKDAEFLQKLERELAEVVENLRGLGVTEEELAGDSGSKQKGKAAAPSK